ncbi:hypothetical protein [Brevibacterium sp. FAM 24630]|uniref:hypothetical protein n=1 Tax=Brevibacterium sp. FAM 24630 TaxID=3415680 RepID=UPI003C7A60F9
MPDLSDGDSRALENGVRRASQLQSMLTAAVSFSILGAAVSVVITIVVAANGEVAASVVSGLLSLLLMLEIAQQTQQGIDFDLSRVEASRHARERAAYEHAFRPRRFSRILSGTWYVFFFLTLAIPSIAATCAGYHQLAYKTALACVFSWGFGVAISVLCVRSVFGITRRSRVTARVLGPTLFTIFWMVSVQITLVFMTDADLESRSILWIYGVTYFVALVFGWLRAWGESGWSAFGVFGQQYVRTLREADDSIIASVSTEPNSGKTLLRFCLELLIVLAPAAVIGLLNFGAETAWYPALLSVTILVASAAARWSVSVERWTGYVVAILVIGLIGHQVWETHKFGLELSIIYSAMMILAVSLVVWKREQYCLGFGSFLTVVDRDSVIRRQTDLKILGATTECTDASGDSAGLPPRR